METFDKPGSIGIRKAHRAEHPACLDRIKDCLLACGAKLNDDGSDAGDGLSIVAVEIRAAADPFSQAYLFERVEIRRWRKADLDGKS
ncbi:YciI family protein [Methylobacterium phyllostachyos]|uniref:YciI family protein n=1 Tax=Methylobacterium phyllostachyos TaxID=582672 RepID=UPI00244EDF3D|nr:YciI family protein [Methylobacterium phyllostachyos]